MKRLSIALALAGATIIAAGLAPAASARTRIPWAVTARAAPSPVAVTPQQALAAASVPGARTEVAPGMTARQAVGLAPRATGAAYTVSASGQCYFDTPWIEWGVWPYQGRISPDTYWCGWPGAGITYRSTHVRLGVTLCTAGGGDNYRIGGGLGYSYVDVRSLGTFSCGVPYIGGYTHNDWEDARFTYDGWDWTYNWS